MQGQTVTKEFGRQVLLLDDGRRRAVRFTWEKLGHTIVQTWGGELFVLAPPERSS